MRDEQNDVPSGRPGPFGLPANGRPLNGHPSNGHPPNGVLGAASPFTRVLADDEPPIDLVAVQADDELVNALAARPALPIGSRVPVQGGGEGPGGPDVGGSDGGTDDRLVAMLAAWRAEIDAEPIPELVDLDAAVAAVVAGVKAQEFADRRKRAGRIRQLAPLAAAAAIIVATVSGIGLGSQNAMPGDTLWAIQKVVNPERAESVEAKVAVEGRLEKVRAALKQGDTVTAAQELEAIRTEIPVVRGQEGQPQLVQEQEFLAAKLADTPPGTPADLSTPPKSNPAARSTGTPAPAASSSEAPSEDPSVTAPSLSSSGAPSESQSTEPDVRREVDPRLAPVLPSAPDARDRDRDRVVPVPVPDKSKPEVTSAPEVPAPDPKSDPGPPSDEGGRDGTAVPPDDPAPKSTPPGDDDSKPVGDGGGATTTSDTTTAAGSAGSVGAKVETTATDTT
jgi:hypothetical protein